MLSLYVKTAVSEPDIAVLVGLLHILSAIAIMQAVGVEVTSRVCRQETLIYDHVSTLVSDIKINPPLGASCRCLDVCPLNKDGMEFLDFCVNNRPLPNLFCTTDLSTVDITLIFR